LKTADEKAGTKLLCPDCGERVDVPSASADKQKSSAGSSRTATVAKKAPAKQAGGSSKGLFVALAAGAAVLVAGGAGVAMWAMKGKQTEEAKNTSPQPAFPAPVSSTPALPAPTVTPVVTAAPSIPTPPSTPPATPPAAATPDGATSPFAQAPANPGPAKAPEAPQVSKSQPQTSDPDLPHLTSLEGEAAYHRLLRSTCWVYVEAHDGKSGGSGSGALIDREHRLILTAYHVVDLADNGNGKISVSFPVYEKGRVVAEKGAYEKLVNRKEALSAYIEAVDKKKDLALLKIPEIPAGVQPLRLARSSVGGGQRVHSMGNPGAAGDGMWIYSPGNVRQVLRDDWVIMGPDKKVDRYSAHVILAASPVNPGDSGGPMINERKELVGVAHAVMRGANLMAKFIDIESVREFLQVYYTSKRLKNTILDESPPADKNDEIPILVKKLEAPDALTRARAAEVLGQIGADAKPAINQLLKALKDKDEEVRKHAATALEQIGGLTQRQLPAVVEVLKDENPDVRLAAVAVIRLMGGEAESAAPKLMELIKTEKDPFVRRRMAAALGAIGAGKVAVPMLAAALKDESADVRSEAAAALAKLGSAAVDALPALGEALQDNQQDVRVNALKALEAIGEAAKPAVPQIHRSLKERDKDTRLAAVAAVGAIRAEDKDTIKLMIDLLEDKDYRTPVNEALVRIGKSTVPVLNLELNNPKAEIRLGVVQALEALGADSLPAVQRLSLLAQRDANADVRAAAVKAVTTIQKKVTGR
jgi:HEAT repeat protein/S1-C subfamily serine protease